MRFAVRRFIFGLLVSMCFAGSASAQYLRITTDNPTDATRMRAAGTTILTFMLDTNHDKGPGPGGSGGAIQTCNSHTATYACVPPYLTSGEPLDLGGYHILLKAVGGTVTFGTFTHAFAGAVLDERQDPVTQQQYVIDYNLAAYQLPGPLTLGTLAVTILSGAPSIDIARGLSFDASLYPTGFGTHCSAAASAFTYTLAADPADPCGLLTGFTADWLDFDGVQAPASANSPPTITAPVTASAAEGTAMTPITASATDPDAANILTITQSGMPASLVFAPTSGVSPQTATISGTPTFTDAGTYPIVWTVNDGMLRCPMALRCSTTRTPPSASARWGSAGSSA